MAAGVYIDKKKDNSMNYRASITINNKHISLGSYEKESEAANAYMFAKMVMNNLAYNPTAFSEKYPIKFEKYITLLNLRDNGIYFSNPIYIRKRDFSYFLSPSIELKFDSDDLFYFSSHKIIKRGSHLFVSDYGMQTTINERYGIKPYAVKERDYIFVNGDYYDYRRENIKIINRFNGVLKITKGIKTSYKAVIHLRSNYVIGTYPTEKEAAIAYNKAADILTKNGFKKAFAQNYLLEEITNKEYADIYSNVKISEKIILLRP